MRPQVNAGTRNRRRARKGAAAVALLLCYSLAGLTCDAVQASEIGTVFNVLNGKADKAANDASHARLWLFLRISLLAIATGAMGVLVAKAFGL